jgi:hypothetical protein
MATHSSLPCRSGSEVPASTADESAAATACYRRPRLALVGTVTRLVQSGPNGNRYETYQCRYWYDR